MKKKFQAFFLFFQVRLVFHWGLWAQKSSFFYLVKRSTCFTIPKATPCQFGTPTEQKSNTEPAFAQSMCTYLPRQRGESLRKGNYETISLGKENDADNPNHCCWLKKKMLPKKKKKKIKYKPNFWLYMDKPPPKIH